ncbi:MAG: hypothetical protein EWM47_02825 [Anaerolineaceae bacterium]|nr:MAG: hypothetical protein EWM47_02825 [Anaerolineaceae bacterium]
MESKLTANKNESNQDIFFRDILYPDTIDSHVHLFHCSLEGVWDLIDFEKKLGYKAFNYLSCECMDDLAQNALGIYLKLIAPDNYAYGGLHYRYSYDFAKEAQMLMELGFDGMKMVENKPTLRKHLNMATNDPRYDEFYAYMEQTKAPMIIHVADPEEFWDENVIPEWALSAGYYYGDGSFVSKEQIYEETLSVLERYPKLSITFAHFFFLSGDRDRLSKILDRYPSVGLDIVSGTEMYFNFTKDPLGWRDFFLKYQDRIIFGTDNMNLYDPMDIDNALIVNRFEHEFIRTDNQIPAWDKTIQGIGLPNEVQRKIFKTNFQKLAGDKPKPIRLDAAMDYLDGRLKDEKLNLTNREVYIIQSVYNLCKEHKAANI